MFKKLKLKFVLVSTLSVAMMLFAIWASMNMINFYTVNHSADALISSIEANNGFLPITDTTLTGNLNTYQDFSDEAKRNTRYFVVYHDDNNEIIDIHSGNVMNSTAFDPYYYALEVLKENDGSGYKDGFKFKKSAIQEVPAVIFLDVSKEITANMAFLYNSFVISLVALTIASIIAWLLSPFAIKPIVMAYEKQKKFITNASHEIKTPLTVISANMDIIEMKSGENKWLNNSKEQVSKLSELVNSLTALARMDEVATVEKEDFSLSDMAEMVAESFESIAFAQDKTLNASIEKNILYTGNEKNISQLFYIVLDNAFKYANEKGMVTLVVSKNQNRVHITVKNTVTKTNKGNHKAFFDRFYRQDASRNSQNGGHGIGLSLAKAIVSAHKGKIFAKSHDEHSVTVDIVL